MLVAESFSGYIAYQVALGKPKYLKSIIFVATFLENPRPFLLGISFWIPKLFLLSVPLPNYVIKTFLLGRTAHKRMISVLKQSIKRVSPDVLSYRIQEIAKLRNSYQLCDLKAIYIQAIDDNLVPERCLDNFKKVFSNLSVFNIDGPHLILQANPFSCAEVIMNEYTLYV